MLRTFGTPLRPATATAVVILPPLPKPGSSPAEGPAAQASLAAAPPATRASRTGRRTRALGSLIVLTEPPLREQVAGAGQDLMGQKLAGRPGRGKMGGWRG